MTQITMHLLNWRMRRLLAADLLPERAGQPVKALVARSAALAAPQGRRPTSVKDCALFCFFHHQVVIHQWGWTVVLNPDGTTTAWNKDKTKVIHSHSPPVRPG